MPPSCCSVVQSMIDAFSEVLSSAVETEKYLHVVVEEIIATDHKAERAIGNLVDELDKRNDTVAIGLGLSKDCQQTL